MDNGKMPEEVHGGPEAQQEHAVWPAFVLGDNGVAGVGIGDVAVDDDDEFDEAAFSHIIDLIEELLPEEDEDDEATAEGSTLEEQNPEFLYDDPSFYFADDEFELLRAEATSEGSILEEPNPEFLYDDPYFHFTDDEFEILRAEATAEGSILEEPNPEFLYDDPCFHFTDYELELLRAESAMRAFSLSDDVAGEIEGVVTHDDDGSAEESSTTGPNSEL